MPFGLHVSPLCVAVENRDSTLGRMLRCANIGKQVVRPQHTYFCRNSESLCRDGTPGWCLSASVSFAQSRADLILHHGNVVTVDANFRIASALAIADGRIQQVGSDEDMLASKGPQTTLVDLAGHMVMPGLIDSHVHAIDASLTEFDHPIPSMETIDDVLSYVRSRAALDKGQWIVVRQVFITRLREPRYPTRAGIGCRRSRSSCRLHDRSRRLLQFLGPEAEWDRQRFSRRGGGNCRTRPANRRTDRHLA